jgi:hypothetical protein
MTREEVLAIIANPSLRRPLADGKIDFFGTVHGGKA